MAITRRGERKGNDQPKSNSEKVVQEKNTAMADALKEALVKEDDKGDDIIKQKEAVDVTKPEVGNTRDKGLTIDSVSEVVDNTDEVLAKDEQEKAEVKSEPAKENLDQLLNKLEEPSSQNPHSSNSNDSKENKVNSTVFSNALNLNFSANTTEELKKYAENATSFLKANGVTDVKVETIPKRKQTPCPLVVFYAKDETSGKTFAHVQFISKGAPDAKTKSQTVNTANGGQRTITKRKVLSQEYDNRLRVALNDYFTQRKVDKVAYVGHAVVPAFVNLEDESKAALFAVSSVMAIYTRLGRMGSLKLSAVAENNQELYNSINLNLGQTDVNLAGSPIASDFTSTVYVRSKKKQSAFEQVEGEDEDEFGTDDQLLKTSGIVDFLAVDAKPKTDPTGQGQLNTILKPLIISTSCEGISNGQSDYSIEGVSTRLLELAALHPVSKAGNWQSLWNTASRNSTKTSVGVLGLYHNPIPGQPKPGMVDVAETEARAEASNGKQVGPVTFLNSYCRDGAAIIGFDAIHGDRSSWFNNYFVKEATGSPTERATARQIILKAVDDMGDGTFSAKWGDKPILKSIGIVHTGRIVPADSNELDVRSLDNLAKLGALKGDMNAASRILFGKDGTSHEHIHDSYEFMKEMANFVHESYAHRLIWHRDFEDAFIQYLADSGASLGYDGVVSSNTVGIASGIDVSSWDNNGHDTFERAGNSWGNNNGNGSNFYV